MKAVVIAFDTTTDAMKMESYCKKNQVPGRLIPIPNEISAGCGLAFKTESEDIEEVEKFLREADLAFEIVKLIDFK